MNMTNNDRLGAGQGLLIVLSGPSGVGKGTICSALRGEMPELVYSVSATTRTAREGEVDGVNYFFKTKEEFRSMIDNDELLEWAEYVGNYYGTPRSFVEETIRSGKDIILEIEVQGALKVKEKFPDGVFIFIMPPSLSELEHRIQNRGTETIDTIRNRLNVALEEIRLVEQYDYAVVNDEVSAACNRIRSIITAEHCSKKRLLPLMKKWLEEVH